MSSLRRTLLLSLLSAIVVSFALGGYLTYRAALEEADELMDYQLRQFALSLRDQHFSQPLSSPIEAPEQSLDFVIQIWDSAGVRLYLSHPHSVLPSLARFGYTTVDTTEGQWRVFSIPLRNQVIQIAQPMKVRSRIAAGAAFRTLVPTLTLTPLLGVLIWFLIGRGLRPLEQLADEVGKRRPDSLAPLPADRVPDEARPLVVALNDLLHRLGNALSAQRAFVADAAHELRTPLAALQIQLQLTERASDDATRTAALGELRNGLQRATHLVQQLLTLARQEPDAEARPMTTLSAADIARQVLADHAALAHARNVDLGAGTLDDSLQIEGDAAALRTLIGNLVDNAIRYTPEGGRVDLGLHRGERAEPSSPPACVIEIADSGPGIPPEDRERVLARFYRREGSGQPGSGLGLAIVSSIAQRHGARLVLGDSPFGGLLASVHIPLHAGKQP